MHNVFATVHVHGQGARYTVEEIVRPDFVRAALWIDVNTEHLIQCLHVNSARFGLAEWSPAGVRNSIRWETEDEATAVGGWSGLLPAPLGCAGDAHVAQLAAADVLARLPLPVTKHIVARFIDGDPAAPHGQPLVAAARAEIADLAQRSGSTAGAA